MLRTAHLLCPASTPTSRPTSGASLPGTLASPRTGLAPAGCRELVARLRHGVVSFLTAPELLDAHRLNSPAFGAGPNEAVLARARARQQDPDWIADYRATRPKVERKIAHLMRRKHGGRRARVRGRVKVAADFRLLAAAVNLARLGTLGVSSAPSGWIVAGA
jgi:hypothetical protein